MTGATDSCSIFHLYKIDKLWNEDLYVYYVQNVLHGVNFKKSTFFCRDFRELFQAEK